MRLNSLLLKNNGEIPEDKFEALIVAQTTAVQKNRKHYVNDMKRFKSLLAH